MGFMLAQAEVVAAPEFKNPTGFVLGYWVSKTGEIDRKALADLKPNLPGLEYPVRLYDVIRYARLWLLGSAGDEGADARVG
jgi:hypothetical protein